MIYKNVYLCGMNIETKTSYQLRQSNQIMLDKRSFVRGISKLCLILKKALHGKELID